MVIGLRNNYFDILPQYVGEQIMTSKENMAWNLNNNNSSKDESEVKIMTHSRLYQRKERRHNKLIAICYNLTMGPNCSLI